LETDSLSRTDGLKVRVVVTCILTIRQKQQTLKQWRRSKL